MNTRENKLHALSYIVFDWCMKNCEPKMALDIGANIGGITNKLIESKFAVHAFEPVSIPFKELHERFSKDYRVKLNNYGLSDTEEIIKDVTVLSAWTLGTPEKTGLSVCPSYVNEPHFDLRLTTLDKYVSQHELKIGFIKLDVDGYEFKVLKGGEKTLREQRPPMMIEFSIYIKHISGNDAIKQFIEFIFDLGYWIYSMDGKYVFKQWEEVDVDYPYNSSFDVMLMPNNKEYHFTS